jgi:hypothetical protein
MVVILMSFLELLAALTLLGVLAESAAAADLSKIPRNIAKEPAYKTKPKYCLLVFGPEATKKTWLVLDGDVLYVDTNGNGDLTERGKSLRCKRQSLLDSDPGYPLEECLDFSLGDVASGGLTYNRVTITHTVLKKKFEPKTDFGKDLARLLKKDPGLTRLGVQAVRNGKVRIQALGYAADSPKEAPIIHIDGPLTMKPQSVFGLVRGKESCEFRAAVGTQGVGEDTFAMLDYDEIPVSAKPVLEIEFPGRGETGKGKVTIALDRC